MTADHNGGGSFAAMRDIVRHLSQSRRQQLYLLVALLLVGALAELVAIASVIPFLAVMSGSNGLDRFGLVGTLFDLIGADGERSRLIAATLLFAGAALFAGALRLALAWMTKSFAFGFGHDLGVDVQRRLLHQPYAFHAARNSSELIAVQEKIHALVNSVILPAITGFTAIVTSLFIVGILLYIDALVAGIAVVAIGTLYIAVTYLTRQRLYRYGRTVNSTYGDRVQAVQESLGGIRDIIIDHSQPVYLDHFERLSSRFRRAQVATAFISGAPRFVVEAIGMVLIALLALLLSSRSGSLVGALPVLGALALSAQRLLPLLQQAYFGWAQIRTGSAVAEDIAGFLDLPIERDRGPVEPLAFEREIRLDQVGFRYPSRDGPTLSSINVVIPRGSKLALIGKTGSGKSTLADIVMGLLDPDSGRMTVDGVLLDNSTRSAWQSQIAHVPQSIFLADTSIERNIAFGMAEADIDSERVKSAARLAQIDEFVAALPDGYDTFVGERGIRLSGGQRQRIGIARALYKRSRVLILDEATSALDEETEAAVIDGLAGIDTPPTMILIAHRLSTIAKCDIIVRMADGKIIESGSFADVVGKKSPIDRNRKFA